MYQLTITYISPREERMSETVGIKDYTNTKQIIESIKWRYRKEILRGNKINEKIKEKEKTILLIDVWEKRENDIWHGIDFFVSFMNENLVEDLRNINEIE